MGMSTVLTAQQAVPPILPRHVKPERRQQLEADHDTFHEPQRLFIEDCPLCHLQKEIDAISKPQIKSEPKPEPTIIGTWVRLRNVHRTNVLYNEKLEKWEVYRRRDGADVLLGRAETKEAAIRLYQATIQAEQTNTEHLNHGQHVEYTSQCKFCLIPGLARQAGYDR